MQKSCLRKYLHHMHCDYLSVSGAGNWPAQHMSEAPSLSAVDQSALPRPGSANTERGKNEPLTAARAAPRLCSLKDGGETLRWG